MVKPKRSIKTRGNYNDFANSLAALWGIDKKELENHDYNYKEYYNDDPSEAYAQLNKLRTNDPTAHFPDTYKLPTHPTFSVESKYSGKNNNVVGGTWKDNPSDIQRWTYQLSPSQRKNHWNVRRTLEYAGEAEDEGFKVIDDKGRYPVVNGIIQGGVLPTIIVRPKYKEGGIHVSPSKRGTFTAAAIKHRMSVQAFASRVLRNKDNYSPAMVKKANFARNASKWNH